MGDKDRVIVRRAIVSRSGYHWAKVDKSGRGNWDDGQFQISERAARQAPSSPEEEQKTPRPGLYLCLQDPQFLDLPEPGQLAKDNLLHGAYEEIDVDAKAPALFRDFASLPLKPADMQAFADRWGLLGGPVQTTVDMPPPERLRTLLTDRTFASMSSVGVRGEPADRWA